MTHSFAVSFALRARVRSKHDLYAGASGASAAEESQIRTSFSQIDSQQLDIVVEELRTTAAPRRSVCHGATRS
jgi:hypothetical protein